MAIINIWVYMIGNHGKYTHKDTITLIEERANTSAVWRELWGKYTEFIRIMQVSKVVEFRERWDDLVPIEHLAGTLIEAEITGPMESGINLAAKIEVID